MSETLPGIHDEKLAEYLGIWNKLNEQGYKKLKITLQMDFRFDLLFSHPWSIPWICTLTYGEEKRELTYEQALHVKDWLESLKIAE